MGQGTQIWQSQTAEIAVLVSRFVPIRLAVLACFDPKWPNLILAVAQFALAPTQRDGHIGSMGHIDDCLDALRRLIAKGDPNGLPLAEEAIEQYWAVTPVRARKSGLLYIHQILHSHRDTLTGDSRTVADTVDAYIEKKLAT
jgi:hypothetical protein